MKLFLIDNGKLFSYDNLLDKINNLDSFYPAFQNKNLFDFFANLIAALVNDKSVTLVDSDFSQQEIENIGINEVNTPEPINNKKFSSIDELITKVKHSSSNISIYTSGTTGQPKRVEHSYQNLSRAVKIGQKFEGNIWGFAYNPTHMAGLQVFFQAFENQNELINIFNLPREAVYKAISDCRITHISATPTFYRLLLPYERQYDSVVRITLGGEKSEKKLYDSILSIFPNAKITNVYASTEAGTLFAAKGSDFIIPENIRSKFKVIDDELFIHKSLIGTSTSLKLVDDYYPSGDLIEWIDEDKGLFKFKSRKNELINVGGYKVNPQEVEEIIRDIPGIKDVHVFGKQNSVIGNILCADIVKDDTNNISETNIRQLLSAQLQDFKIPRRIKFKDALDMTRTGKMKRI